MNALHQHIAKDGFRLRGTAMSRVDGFSDVVFGFALTLLVVSLEVPKTFDELHRALLGFLPFSVCFCFFFLVWWAHFKFFRRYGLHDAGTIAINCVLLFTVLFYIYPMKFLFTIVVNQFLPLERGTHVFSSPTQVRELMLVYGGGFAATYFCLTALYWNAWRQRVSLRLNALERTLTLSYLWADFGTAFAGVLCCGIVFLIPPEKAGYAGYVFLLISLYQMFHGAISKHRVRAAELRLHPGERAAALEH